MESKDIRQRSVASQHQKYPYQTDESLRDDKKYHARRSRYILSSLFVGN